MSPKNKKEMTPKNEKQKLPIEIMTIIAITVGTIAIWGLVVVPLTKNAMRGTLEIEIEKAKTEYIKVIEKNPDVQIGLKKIDDLDQRMERFRKELESACQNVQKKIGDLHDNNVRLEAEAKKQREQIESLHYHFTRHLEESIRRIISEFEIEFFEILTPKNDT